MPILSKKCHFKSEKVYEKVFEKSGLKKVSLETIVEEKEEEQDTGRRSFLNPFTICEVFPN